MIVVTDNSNSERENIQNAQLDENSNSFQFNENINDTQLTCPICLSEISDDLVKLRCGHFYHKLCIYQWLINERKDTCPICRLDVVNQLPNHFVSMI